MKREPLTPSRRTPRRCAVVLATALALGAVHVMAEGTAAAQNVVVKTYNGSDCVTLKDQDLLGSNYSAANGVVGVAGIRCPIVRTQQTYSHVYAEIMLGDVTTSTHASCRLISGSEFEHWESGPSDDQMIWGSGLTLYVELTMTTQQGAAPFWTPMGNDANAHWRTEAIDCDAAAGLPILGYMVTEYP